MADLVLTLFLMHSPLIDESRIQYFRYNTASVQLTLTESCPKRDVRDTATYLPYLPGQHAGKGRFDAFLLLLQRFGIFAARLSHRFELLERFSRHPIAALG